MTALRSLHLVGVGGCGGAFLYEGPREIRLPFLMLTVVSGLVMVLLEIWSSGYWIIELRGIAIIAKLLLLGLALVCGCYVSRFYSLILECIKSVSEKPQGMNYMCVNGSFRESHDSTDF